MGTPSGFSPQNFSLKKPALKKFLTFSQKNVFLIFWETDFSSPKNKNFQEGTF